MWLELAEPEGEREREDDFRKQARVRSYNKIWVSGHRNNAINMIEIHKNLVAMWRKNSGRGWIFKKKKDYLKSISPKVSPTCEVKDETK